MTVALSPPKRKRNAEYLHVTEVEAVVSASLRKAFKMYKKEKKRGHFDASSIRRSQKVASLAMQQMNSDFGVDVFDVDGSGGAKQAMVLRAQKWFTRSPRLMALLFCSYGIDPRFCKGEGVTLNYTQAKVVWTKWSTRRAVEWVIGNYDYTLRKSHPELTAAQRSDMRYRKAMLTSVAREALHNVGVRARADALAAGVEVHIEDHDASSAFGDDARGRGPGLVACAAGKPFVKRVLATLLEKCK